MSPFLKGLPLAAVAALAGCASLPSAPSMMSLPGTGKSFDQFRYDDAVCRQFAYQSVGGTSAQQAGESAAVTSAVVGTAVGAAAGGAIGGGSGAAIGAGSGLILGAAAGTGYASGAYYAVQQRYDNSYLQCMYAKGNRIPVYGHFTAPAAPQPPAPGNYPPPPPPR
jgi:hypothetical protein